MAGKGRQKGEQGGKGAGQLGTENWPNINEHQRKTCNLQLGRQWKYRELVTGGGACGVWQMKGLLLLFALFAKCFK